MCYSLQYYGFSVVLICGHCLYANGFLAVLLLSINGDPIQNSFLVRLKLIGTEWLAIVASYPVTMPRCEVRYTIVCLCVVCVDCYSCSRINEVQVRIGF